MEFGSKTILWATLLGSFLSSPNKYVFTLRRNIRESEYPRISGKECLYRYGGGDVKKIKSLELFALRYLRFASFFS